MGTFVANIIFNHTYIDKDQIAKSQKPFILIQGNINICWFRCGLIFLRNLRKMSMLKKTHKIKTVVFDLDGVLVETISLKADAHAATVRSFGGDVDQNLYSHLIGLSHDNTRAAFIQASNIEIDPVAYTKIYRHLLSEYLTNKPVLTPGIHSLLNLFSENGYSLAVVTSSPRAFLDECLQQTGIARYFSVYISADDVKNKKPAPDPYLLAIEKLSIAPETMIVFEDTEAGLDSALLAGVQVMIFRHRYNTNQDFSNADHVFDYPIDACDVFQLVQNFIPREG